MSVGDQRRTVGVVGLGRMGGPMAGHLAAAGHDVLGYDPGPSATPPDAVRRVPEMADLGECDVVLVTAGGRAVGDILVADGRLRPVWRDRDVLVCSTVDPDEMRRLHAVAGARQGTLLALVGGDAGVLARTADVLRAFCSDVVHVGGPGAGQTAKLVNNMLLWSNIASVVEGLRLAEQLGVARGPLVEGLLMSSANSWVLETWARPREIPWADEDMRMVLESAERVGLDAPVSRVVQEAIADVRRSGAVAEGGFGATGWARPAYPTEEEEGSVASG